MSVRECGLRERKEMGAFTSLKDSIHCLFMRSIGLHGGRARRLFSLRDRPSGNCDTLLFINDIKYDIHSHTLVCGAFVLPSTHLLLPRIKSSLGRAFRDGQEDIMLVDGEITEWKRMLPLSRSRRR